MSGIEEKSFMWLEKNSTLGKSSRRLVFGSAVFFCLSSLHCWAAEEVLVEEGMSTAERFTLLVGKLHPVLVHFPIALLCIAGLVEVVRFFLKGKKNFSDNEKLLAIISVSCVTFGAVGAVLACVAGWINAQSQEFFGSLEQVLFLHRWGGIGVASVALICSYVGFRSLRSPKRAELITYRSLTCILLFLVLASAHYGGKMVYGETYFSEVFEGTRFATFFGGKSSGDGARAMLSPEQIESLPNPASHTVSFKKEVLPLFEETCGNCHLAGKAKGGLQLDTLELSLKGGESGTPALVVGQSAESYLIHLVSGLNPDSVMPNKGRRLTEDEVGLLRAWIDQGANFEGQHEVKAFEKVPYQHRGVMLPPSSKAHPIDRLLEPYYEERGITPADPVDDRTFIRRAFLDVTGLLPSWEEVRTFLQDTDTAKREKLILELLSRNSDYAAHWMTFWNDLLRNDYTGPGFLHGGRREVSYWLHSALTENVPLDKFVSELVSPESSLSAGFTKGVLWWSQAEEVNPNEHPAMQAAQNVGQVFMGINMKCASCHDSFTDAWKLSDAYGLANVFAEEPLEVHECNQPTGEIVPARFVVPELGEIDSPLTSEIAKKLEELTELKDLPRAKKEHRLKVNARKERMESLATRLTSRANGRFARTFVNRIWAQLFGRGIVEPLDEMDSEPWNRDLLDWLAFRFAEGGFDVKELLYLIMTSEAYQLPSDPAKEKYGVEDPFRGPRVRRVSAEQFVDAVHQVAGLEMEANEDELRRFVRIAKRDYRKLKAMDDEGSASPGSDRWKAREEAEAQKIVSRVNPTLRFESGLLNSEKAAARIDVDISGAESLWLVVLPRHRMKSALELLEEKHQQVALQEREGKQEDIKKDSDDNRENLSGEDESALEHALWISPRIELSGRKPIRLVEQDPVLTHAHQSEFFVLNSSHTQAAGHSIPSVNEALRVLPFSVIRYDLRDLGVSHGKARLTGAIGFDRPFLSDDHKYEFLIFTDAPFRSVFKENTQLLWTLGRPKREQVATSRPTVATTVQALELTNGEEFSKLLKVASLSLQERSMRSPKQFVENLYQRMFSRAPTTVELSVAEEYLRRRSGAEGIEDLLWALLLSPEFQLIG